MSSEGQLSKHLTSLLTFEWQPAEPVLQALTRFVPPGQAQRKYDGFLTRQDRRGKAVQTIPSAERQLASGRRAIANQCIGGQVSCGKVEIDNSTGVRMIRRVERRQNPQSVVVELQVPEQREHLIKRLTDVVTDPEFVQDLVSYLADSLLDVSENES